MEAAVELATVAAVGGVGFVDIAVAAFELAVGGGFVDYAGAAVVGEGGEEDLSKPQHYPKNIVFYSVNHSVIG